MSARQHREKHRASAEIAVCLAEQPFGPFWLARDIGPGGLFLEGSLSWGVGETRAIVIRQQHHALRVEARVLRNGEDGVGLEFINLTDEHRQLIREFIASLFARGADIDEKRRAPRRPVAATAWWERNDEINGTRLEDVSMTGARAVSSQPPPVGTELFVYIAPPDTSPPSAGATQAFGCTCVVTRLTEDGFALSFRTPSQEFKDAMQALRIQALRQPTGDESE